MAKLITYSNDASAQLTTQSDNPEFYQQLFKLNEIAIELGKAPTLDDLFRLAVENCLNHLAIDRMGILMIEQKTDGQQWMRGTWGTDEVGNVRSESHDTAPILDKVKQVIHEVSTQGKVCVWHDQSLYEFTEKQGEIIEVGHGWNAAIAIWDKDVVIGWVACDNLLQHRPFEIYQSHILRLFGSLLGELIKQKLAEQTQQHLNQQLRSTLAQLQHTQKELIAAEKHAALNDLVIGMAHEMNTPLGVIKTAASLQPEVFKELQQDLSSGTISKNKLVHAINVGLESQSLIDVNIDKIAQLVSQFKRLSALQHSQNRNDNIVLNDWLTANVKLYLTPYQQQLALLNISVEAPEQSVIIDSQMLGQVLESLLQNAMEHGLCDATQGQLKVSAKILNKNSAATQGEAHQQPTSQAVLVLLIEDNGPGIAPHLVDKVFDAFYTSSRGKGNKGLGLHMVYNLVKQGLKGEINHFQPAAGGCGFSLTLPIAPNQ
ncbi:ATP-binding protein [Motilimonas pumila]|uniref:histidine kinase n=1 Tax=Motilimonas pumila TaxID=2303987 RepID=A0A418YHB4_9GAMM|nr:ATP-binding protein [Motilimonas pumila]RJG49437.1 hypothetical protein D1Z90_05615 [Motilimonas pumila]